jgi:gamma-glutamyltranspeptidase
MGCATQPLAAQAGLDMLKKGGNAIDAAIATAACLTLIEPTSNGIGSDAFAILWTKNSLHGLNSSGPSPMGLTLQKVKAAGHEKMPARGWLPVTVPGAPAAWAELSRRFGKLPLAAVLEPAARYAEEGFPSRRSRASAGARDLTYSENLTRTAFCPGKRFSRPRAAPRWRARFSARPILPKRCGKSARRWRKIFTAARLPRKSTRFQGRPADI